ncbi:MAG: hypothetical protein GX299_07815 [Epulopiscium sp.]|jgi:phage tail P2-like protein|nr:hypothetical protein [Candidatus Epulonipiscium sp.]
MIKLKDGGLLSILPPNFATDVEIQCFCYAIDRQIQKLIAAADKISIFYTKKWDDRLCDYLAMELRTPFYSEDMALETKRELIGKSLFWYAKLGTADAVKEIIETVLGYAEIEEETSGPYTFTVCTTDATITGEKATEFARQIEGIKNVRSDFLGIQVLLTENMNVYIGFAGHSGSREELSMVY